MPGSSPARVPAGEATGIRCVFYAFTRCGQTFLHDGSHSPSTSKAPSLQHLILSDYLILANPVEMKCHLIGDVLTTPFVSPLP